MPTELDLRSPTIVLVGRWNDAILNEPGWVARYLLDLPEGTPLEVGTFARQENGVPISHVWSFGTFAMSCVGVRLELFQTSKSFTDLYDILNKLVTLLPHTPVSGLGINFKISSDEEIGISSERLETKEMLDSLGAAKAIERIENLKLENDEQLNIEDAKLRQCQL